MSQIYDVCIIGAGPGGYVSAIRASQKGLSTVVIEKAALGGVCLNVGCIPSKALITAAHFYHRATHDAKKMGFEMGPIKIHMDELLAWKNSVCEKMSGGVQQLLKGNNITVVRGMAQFKSQNEIVVKQGAELTSIQAKNFVIATGSSPINIPGFPYDEKDILSSTGALDLNKIPPRLVVIGGGYIGLEISSYLAKLGSQVTILEASKSLLSGLVDKDCVQVVARQLKKSGVKVVYEAFAKAYEKFGSDLTISAEVKGELQKYTADKVLVTVGRTPNSKDLDLATIGVAVDAKGFIQVNEQNRTSCNNIFAIGDIAQQPMLAHKASYEGVLVADIIAGENRVYDPKTIPAVIFTDPEIASCGWTEEECKENGHPELKIGKFPFAANGRAVSMMETNGLVKIIADAKTHIILGVHIVGPEASQLISEGALAIEMGTRLEDIALTVHPHPTLGETMMEAAEAALGHAIHIIQKPLSKKPTSAPPLNLK